MWVSDLHFMVQWFCLISWRLFDECCTEDIQCDMTYKYICRSVTYFVYSDSALSFQYYLMNKPHSLDNGSDMGHWPVFHDLVILNHSPISAYSGLLTFNVKIFVNVARLEIGQLFTQGMRRGHPCTLDTFLVDKIYKIFWENSDFICLPFFHTKIPYSKIFLGIKFLA